MSDARFASQPLENNCKISICSLKRTMGSCGPLTFEEILQHSKENCEKYIAFFVIVLYNTIV